MLSLGRVEAASNRKMQTYNPIQIYVVKYLN